MALKKPFQFKAHPKKAISFWLITLALVGVVIWLTKTSIWFHRSKLFLTSYAEWGLELHDFNLNEDSEYFFDNPKISRNIITLSRMMTNLLPSENSSSNPMVIMELSLEGVSAESVIEMKDREAEFKDMFLRLVEEFSYDDLEAAQGKQKLADLVLIKANENLTRGQVRKVFYKSFIIKP